MSNGAARWSGWMGRRVWALAIVLAAAGSARAQTGPFFEPSALEPMGYELRLSADYQAATRSDFTRPVFLIAQPLSELSAYEVLLRADLRLSITPRLAMQISLPWSQRWAAGRSSGLQVSREQTLAASEFELSGNGLSDPLIGVAYKFLRALPWRAYAEVGSVIPIDDNPDSSIFPQRVPVGTGQHVLFAGAGVNLERPIELSLAYRFGFSPGEHATYLIRRAGAQVFTSGAFGPFIRQRVSLAASLPVWSVLSLWLMPEWTASEVPLLIEVNGSRQVQFPGWVHEIAVQLALRVQLGRHRLELHGSLPLLTSWDLDPFFPIAIPARGVGFTWQVVGS